MNNGQYLIAANSKRAQLIFNIFRPIDLIIAVSGASVTILMFLIIKPSDLTWAIITLLPLLICAFLVLPIPNYQNMLCVLKNIYVFFFREKQSFRWKGWCVKDEFK